MTVQYQGVWTLQSAAQLQSTQRWVTDPLFENTTLLLQADDAANGAQNNTFLDSSSNAFAITRNGNTTQGSFTPFSLQPGAWSNFFNGSSDNLTFNASSAGAFGTGDFTVELWVYKTASGDTSVIDARTSNAPIPWVVDLNSDIPSWYNGASNQGTMTISQNAWNHIAFCRSGTTHRIFINGIQTHSFTDNTNYSSQGSSATIGRNIGAGGPRYFPGYISNIRIVKGTALYTSAFTPSATPLTAVTNTSLLTCQSNRFVDNSSSPLTISVGGGTPSVQAFSPFVPQFQWTPSVIGGSGYFDGTGDWINVADSTAFTLGSGNFTVEFWVYSTTAGIRQFISGQTNSAGANTAASFTIEKTSANKLLGSICSGSSSFAATSSGDIPLNAWTHIALVRDGNTLRQYINGVQDGTADVTGVTANDSSNQLSIGRLGEITTNNYFGYISNYRFVNGTAVYTGAFTPPIAPVTTSGPASSYSSTTNVNTTFTATNTALLTNFTNAGIYDGTMKNNLETVGNAQISTAVVKYGSGSLAFDGSGDWLVAQYPISDLTAFGTGDFTIEMWVRFGNAATSPEQIFLDFRPGGGAQISPMFYVLSNTVRFYVNNADRITSGNVSSNIWYHLAVCRANGLTRMFLDGVQTGSTYTDTNSYISGASRPYIGASQSGGQNFNGYIDDLRITKGIARYTQNFIPPSVALPRQ